VYRTLPPLIREEVLTVIPQVNRQLHLIIQHSTWAQYIMELDATGNIDVPNGMPMGQKLGLLREHEARRRGLNFRTLQYLSLIRPSQSQSKGVIMGCCGLFAEIKATTGPDRTDIRIWHIPLHLNPSPPSPVTTTFNFSTRYCVLNEACDLLVVIRRLPRYVPFSLSHPRLMVYRSSQLEIHLLTISSRLPHPMATTPIIVCAEHRSFVDRKLNEKLLGLTVYQPPDGSRVVIYDWRTGDVVAVRIYKCN